MLLYINDHGGVPFQVLFKKLKVDTTEIDPTSLLKNRGRIIEGNHDFSPSEIVKENQVQFPTVHAGPFYEGGLTSYQVCYL